MGYDTYHKTYLTLTESIHKSLNRINLHLRIFESTQKVADAYQSSCSSGLSFSCLNRFTH